MRSKAKLANKNIGNLFVNEQAKLEKGEIKMAGVYSAGDFRNGTTFEMEGKTGEELALVSSPA